MATTKGCDQSAVPLNTFATAAFIDIAAARRDFFGLYPDKPGVREAGDRLARMLAQKDMVVLKQSLATRLSRSALASSAGMFGTSIFMAQMPDGGISAGAHPAFRMYEY